MQELLKGPRLWLFCAVLVLMPPVWLVAYYLAPKDVTPEEARGTLYVYSADR